jgi:hypothetical protein
VDKKIRRKVPKKCSSVTSQGTVGLQVFFKTVTFKTCNEFLARGGGYFLAPHVTANLIVFENHRFLKMFYLLRVPAAMFLHLVESLPRRVEAVIAAKRGLHMSRCPHTFGRVVYVDSGIVLEDNEKEVEKWWSCHLTRFQEDKSTWQYYKGRRTAAGRKFTGKMMEEDVFKLMDHRVMRVRRNGLQW